LQANKDVPLLEQCVKAKPEQKRSLFAAASIYTGLQAPGYVPNAGCLRTVAAVLIYYTPYDISFVMDATENHPCFHQSIICHYHGGDNQK
jgi:hypothetical protein